MASIGVRSTVGLTVADNGKGDLLSPVAAANKSANSELDILEDDGDDDDDVDVDDKPSSSGVELLDIHSFNDNSLLLLVVDSGPSSFRAGKLNFGKP